MSGKCSLNSTWHSPTSMDNVSPEVRSRTMRAVHARNTAPEVRLRRGLFGQGLRGYRVTPCAVPGHPDIAYTKARLAIFVDGCYWHGCPSHCRRPSSNAEYWNAKIDRNMARDKRMSTTLQRAGWTVVRIWEHEVKENLSAAIERVRGSLTDLRVLDQTGAQCLDGAGATKSCSDGHLA